MDVVEEEPPVPLSYTPPNFSAIILPPIETVVSNLNKKTGKEKMSGNITEIALEQTELLKLWSKKKKIPIYTSVEKGVQAAELNITKTYAAQ